MSNINYIFDNQDSDADDKHDFLISPCFQVSPGVELKEVPTNGEEYLLTVINERKKCAVVTKCNKDYSKYAKNQTCFVKEVPIAKASDKLQPTKEWQNIQVADFSEVRMQVSRLYSDKSTWPSNLRIVKVDQSVEGMKQLFTTKEPTLTNVFGIPYKMVDRALLVLTIILDDIEPGNTVDYRIGSWIYALLAFLRQPLLSNTISIIRNLARKCAEIRSRIDGEKEGADEAVAPLNVFICLVGRYFGQHDLAD